MKYKHTQIGYLILSILAILLILLSSIMIISELYITFLIIIVLFTFILISFSTLKVTIDKNILQIKFGYGIFKKNFLIKDIESVRTKKNHWYYGWGIRLWLWPKMWIFNISGFNAVEMKMKNGGLYRIGTDEPKKLEAAIREIIK
jgi:hypothetical protein